MDHDQTVRQKATERYLLDELDPELRDEFEEHLFDCQDCALDVREAAIFVEHCKVILAEPRAVPSVKEPTTAIPKSGRFAWLRPVVAVPVFALLLGVIGYQNLVTYPKLTQAENQPLIGSWLSVNVATRGTEAKQVDVRAGEGFGVLLEIPPQNGFISYLVDLYNPAGKLEWWGRIPVAPAQENRQIYIPGRNRQPGTYALVVSGISPAGESKELSRHSIDLQLQN